MRIVLTSPDGQTKIGLVTTIGQLKAVSVRSSETGWPRDPSMITSAMLMANGVQGRVSVETPKPEVAEFGERAVDDDERQPDGTWRQVWTIQPTMTLAQAKTMCAQLALDIYWQKTVLDTPTVAEMTTANADPPAVITARRDKYRPVLNNVRTAIQDAATIAECWTLYKQLRDAT